MRDGDMPRRLAAAAAGINPSARAAALRVCNGQAVGIPCCLRSECTRAWVHALPGRVRRPSASRRSATLWSGSACANSRKRATTLSSVRPCQPRGGQRTSCRVVAPPLQTTAISARRARASTLSATSVNTNPSRRLRSTWWVVAAPQSAGKPSAKRRTACRSASSSGSSSVRRTTCVFLFELLERFQGRVPAGLEGTRDKAVFRLDGVVLALRALCLVAGTFDPQLPVAVERTALSLEHREGGQGGLDRRRFDRFQKQLA